MSESMGPAAERRRRYRRGLLSELLAAGLLTAKGYRILARRFRSPVGEIDIVAVRGRRLAFVEVKRRASMDEAELAITPRQSGRIRRAAEVWLKRNPRYAGLDPAIDLVLVVPGRWPRHLTGVHPHGWGIGR